ncbi:MAG TPA: hypothetical protein PKV48_03210 [Thermodesulfobacteriota bacterium]|nr:hypothetical protein [Thermodesulfobacteriota bacterium]
MVKEEKKFFGKSNRHGDFLRKKLNNEGKKTIIKFLKQIKTSFKRRCSSVG